VVWAHGLAEGGHGLGWSYTQETGTVLIFKVKSGEYQLALRHVTHPKRGWIVIGAAPPLCWFP
jgi:hypothetical protein